MNARGKMTRVVVIVLDSVGVGALPDASLFGDAGAHTLGHIAERAAALSLASLHGIPAASKPLASYGKMAEASPAKDTMTGHWEMMGIILQKGAEGL